MVSALNKPESSNAHVRHVSWYQTFIVEVRSTTAHLVHSVKVCTSKGSRDITPTGDNQRDLINKQEGQAGKEALNKCQMSCMVNITHSKLAPAAMQLGSSAGWQPCTLLQNSQAPGITSLELMTAQAPINTLYCKYSLLISLILHQSFTYISQCPWTY